MPRNPRPLRKAAKAKGKKRYTVLEKSNKREDRIRRPFGPARAEKKKKPPLRSAAKKKGWREKARATA